ncbi:glutathione S-transferase family protein [Kordiimonas marina]|uniref:glutathione S-transferase family protein n=1 Tax=Kordiimonas marina TaxID=2872312 RepID=UPI001FF1C7A5|nr:glutathione S-transferase family protein [Kordiimonas marina]MCJ9429386.1 glutathione S-transferase family protein [Kordiimonas marina]
MQLRGMSLSPYYERVVIVLDVKNALDRVEHGRMPGVFGSPELKAENPTGKIPYLILDDGSILPEGQVIAEYLNAVFEGETLMPEDPLATARVRVFGRLVDLYLGQHTMPLARTVTRGTYDDAALALALETGIPDALDHIEFHLSGGPYAVGDSFTMADAALIPFMFHLTSFLAHFELKPFEGRPKLEAWWNAHKDTPLVERCFGRMQKSLDFVLSLRAAAK